MPTGRRASERPLSRMYSVAGAGLFSRDCGRRNRTAGRRETGPCQSRADEASAIISSSSSRCTHCPWASRRPTAVMAGEARCRRSTKSAEFRRSSATVLPTSSGEYELVPNPAKPVDSEGAKNKYPPAQADGREAAHSFYHHGCSPLAENVSCLSHIRRLS